MLKKFSAIFLAGCILTTVLPVVNAQDLKEQLGKKQITGVTFSDQSQIYDGTEHELLLAGEIPQGATVTYSDNKKTDVGTVNAKAVIELEGYDPLTLYANLIIEPKPLTLIGATATKTYDATADVILSGGTLEGIVGTDEVLLSEQVTGTLASVHVGSDIPVSVNAITLSGADKDNYTVTPPTDIEGIVTPAKITVTADSQTKGNGDADPALTYQITEGQLFGTDILSGSLTRNAGETGGTYAISRGSLTAPVDYEMTFVDGIFTIVDKAVQNISLAPIPAKTYGDEPFALSIAADSASGLNQFTFTSSDESVATVSPEGIVTIVGAGEAGITVTQPGNAYYAPASRTETLTVHKKALNFSVENATVEYGAALNLQIKGEGFVAGDDETVLTKAVEIGGFQNPPSAGTHQIILSGAQADNYDIAYTDAQLIVNKKTLTVTNLQVFDKLADGTVNGEISQSSFAVSGLLAGDEISIDTASATVAFASSEVGENIPVEVSNLKLSGKDAGNYQLASDRFTTAADILAQMNASIVASKLGAPVVAKNTTSFALPNVPTGYRVAVSSSDNEAVISKNAVVTPVGEPTSVSVVFAVSSLSDSSDIGYSAPVAIVVPASDKVNVSVSSTEGSVRGGGEYIWNSQVTLTANDTNKYAFEGWYEGDNRVSTQRNYSFRATEDVSYTAKYKQLSLGGSLSGPVYFQIAFIGNGGSKTEPAMVPRNGYVPVPANPTKAGYTFEGWYKDAYGHTKFDFNTKVTAPFSLYAKWTKFPNVKMILEIGNRFATVNGNSVSSDVAPLIRDNRTFTPARFVAEWLGAEVFWNEEERLVTITQQDTEILLTIGSRTAYVNGTPYQMDTAAFIDGDRTYTPSRFIAEHLGADVSWNQKTQEVTIVRE